MTWVADMGLSWIDLAFHPTKSLVYVLTAKAPVLYVYDQATLTQKSSHQLTSAAKRLFVTGDYMVLLRETLGGLPKTAIEIKHLNKL